MTPAEIIRNAAREAMEKAGIGIRKFEERQGLQKWSLQGFLDRNRSQVPSVDRAAEICDALGLEFYVGPPREEPGAALGDRLSEVQAELERLHGQALAATKSMVAPVDGSGEEDPSKRYIEMLEVEPSAGGGSHIEDAPVRGRLAFRRAWLNLHALIASECVVIRVRGESMEPTLPDKCSILIAKHRNRRRDKHIFVVRTEDGLIVKRARKDGKAWLLVSDHPAWKDLPWPRDADVIGEVVWMAKTLD